MTIEYCKQNNIGIIGNQNIIWSSKKFNPYWKEYYTNDIIVILNIKNNWEWTSDKEYLIRNYKVKQFINLEELEDFCIEPIYSIY